MGTPDKESGVQPILLTHNIKIEETSLLIRLLALIALLWTGKQVFKQVSSVFQPHQKVDDTSPGREIEDEMVKDPVCLTYIPKSLAIQKTFDRKKLYFCSKECASKFLEQYQSTS